MLRSGVVGSVDVGRVVRDTARTALAIASSSFVVVAAVPSTKSSECVCIRRIGMVFPTDSSVVKVDLSDNDNRFIRRSHGRVPFFQRCNDRDDGFGRRGVVLESGGPILVDGGGGVTAVVGSLRCRRRCCRLVITSAVPPPTRARSFQRHASTTGNLGAVFSSVVLRSSSSCHTSFRTASPSFPRRSHSSYKEVHHVDIASSLLSYSTSTSSVPGHEIHSGMNRLLTEEQRSLLRERDGFVRRVRNVASRVPGVDGDVPSGAVGFGGVLAELLRSRPSSSSSSSSESDGNDKGREDNHDDVDDVHIIDSTFLVVVAGEFNAGKSTLINALLGTRLLETGALPTTDEVTVLTSDVNASHHRRRPGRGGSSDATDAAADDDDDDASTTTVRKAGLSLHLVPASLSPLLSDLALVDTPGTNSILMDHTSRTLKLLPSADLILFVTSADRPFPESERTLLRSIRTYRKNVTIVLNKMDVLDSSGGHYGQKEKDRLIDFVRDAAAAELSGGGGGGGGTMATVIPVSARDALSARIHSGYSSIAEADATSKTTLETYRSSSLYHRSNFEALERHLRSSLTSTRRIQSKLLNPLGVAEGTLDLCLASLSSRAKELELDASTLDLMQGQMGGWVADTERLMKEWREEACDAMTKEGRRVETLVGRMRYVDMWKWTVLDGGTNAGKKDGGGRFRLEWDRSGPLPPLARPDAPAAATAPMSAAAVATDPTPLLSESNDDRWGGVDGNLASASAAVEERLLRLVRSASSTLSSRASAQGKAAVDYLGRRPAIRSGAVVGTVSASRDFGDFRAELESRLVGAVRSALRRGGGGGGGGGSNVRTAPLDDCAVALSHVRTTALLSGAAGLSAVGLAGGCAAFLPDLMDAYAIAVASSAASLAALSAAVVPYRNGRLASYHSEEWNARCVALDGTLDDVLTTELKRARRTIEEGVEPYARYVRTEREGTKRLREECEDLKAEGHALRGRINRIGS